MRFKTAILIIHGFVGGTYDQENLANYLELNRKFDVFAYTLPGHDKNLSKVKYNEWITYSEEKIEWLIDNGYKNIYLIGHSMGGVIASYLSTKYKQVKKLVLAAPSFHYLNVTNEKLNVADSLKQTPEIIKEYGSEEIISRILKLNVAGAKEFMKLVREYYNSPKEINCPVLIIQGKNDKVVPISSSKYVYETVKSKIKKIVYVEGLGHEVFKSSKDKEIFKLVENFFKYIVIGGEYNI